MNDSVQLRNRSWNNVRLSSVMMRLVVSGHIRAIGYHAEAAILVVEFHGGRYYKYYPVPEEVYRSLMNAPSKGRYFNHHIRNHYLCLKIGPWSVGG